MTLEIKNLNVSVEKKTILHGVSLSVKPGEVVALMGPNGSGKSTLANALMGHPRYTVVSGSVDLDGESLVGKAVDERARKGLFLSFQHPSEIEGVTVENFLRQAYMAKTGRTVNVLDFYKLLYQHMDSLKVDREFAKRYLNVGFSGGEKKRLEALQLSLLEPKYAILDETDSGLDVDALKTIALAIEVLRGKKMGILVITHYTRILKHLVPDKVLIMKEGKIVETGGAELAHRIEEHGYENTSNGAK